MKETHICVVDGDGEIVLQANAASCAEVIAAELAKAPACRRVIFETGRMAPMLYHGLREHGVPVVCIESRQTFQALKSLATHKTDRNDADLKRMTRASDARRQIMTIPGVGHITALAFMAAVDDPERFRRSRDIGAYPASCRAAINPARSITPAVSPRAAIVVYARCSMRRPMSC